MNGSTHAISLLAKKSKLNWFMALTNSWSMRTMLENERRVCNKRRYKRADDGSGKAYDTSTTWSDYKNKNVYSKREMRHTTDNVYYYRRINYDYSGEGKYTYSTTLNTNIK